MGPRGEQVLGTKAEEGSGAARPWDRHCSDVARPSLEASARAERGLRLYQGVRSKWGPDGVGVGILQKLEKREGDGAGARAEFDLGGLSL